MFTTFREQWLDLKHAKPGNRFKNRYHARKNRRCNPLVKPFYMLIGMTVFFVGVVLMFAPGPGFLLIFVGSAMLAGESLLSARALDWTELKLRALLRSARRVWKRASAGVKALLAVFAASLAGLAALIGYTLFFA